MKKGDNSSHIIALGDNDSNTDMYGQSCERLYQLS